MELQALSTSIFHTETLCYILQLRGRGGGGLLEKGGLLKLEALEGNA